MSRPTVVTTPFPSIDSAATKVGVPRPRVRFLIKLTDEIIRKDKIVAKRATSKRKTTRRRRSRSR